jgi:hypothetical protein
VASGLPAVQATCTSIGLGLDPWQVGVARCILAKDAVGLYAADTCVLSIARQVGKTYLIAALVFADAIINPGTTTVWTAHRFKVARETFNALKTIATSPALAPHIDADEITTAAGNECIPFRNDSRIVFAARERGAIRGFSKVRRLILDEAQILTEAAMADLAPTMNQAENPQMILMGTPPKPTDPGASFANLRAESLAGRAEGTVYVEFSAPRGADLDDRTAWREANPSYPLRTPDKAIVRLRKLLVDDDDFAREALGIWSSDTDGTAFNVARWADLADAKAERGKAPVFAVATAPDRSWAAIAVAWRRPDGRAQVMLADYQQGASWVPDRLAELRTKWRGSVVADTASRGMVADADESAAHAPAHNALADAVLADTVRHGNQPALNVAIAAARWRPSGETRVLDRRGSVDISPAAAAALAVHGVLGRPSYDPLANIH